MTSIDDFIEELQCSLMAASPGELKPETRFRELPWWDSLAILGTLGAFDTCFGKQLSTPDLKDCETIRDLHALGTKRDS